jgi:UDP-N-acetylglucosamine--N-acetylmuramyl-(pentapeptide) pyrophosphoryl-undecaprenol N-acetylglucosamine transferase
MRVLAVAGASGGHIFPAIGFLDDFKAAYPDAQTLLVMPARSIRGKIASFKHPAAMIGVSALSLRPSWSNIAAAFGLVKSFFESIIILARFKPDIVVGFGSIASIPVVVCAFFFRVPVMIHEQNVLPGRANRFLSSVSDRVAISFRETARYLSSCRTKLVWTGNTVRASLADIDRNKALEYFGLSAGRITILVMGGSQASRRINFAFALIFKALAASKSVQVIHLCGDADIHDLEREYGAHNASVRLVSFLSEMQYGYSAADLVISRAGATTVAELMRYRKPAILIPYPYANAHQDANAQFLAAAGCAAVVRDEHLSVGGLGGALEAALRPDTLERMRRSYGIFDKDRPVSLVTEAVTLHRYG